ncbi:MAG: hypothetical protein V1928_05490 [Parcubacteria group bacterium]
MDFENLAKKVGYTTSMKIQWKNQTLPENFLDKYPFDGLWGLYVEIKNLADFPSALKKKIVKKITLFQNTSEQWAKLYKKHCESTYCFFHDSKWDEKTIFIFTAMATTAKTFNDWKNVIHFNYSAPYAKIENRKDYSIAALSQMVNLAVTFDEWKEIYNCAYHINPSIKKLAFAKMCELEKAEQ